MPRSDKEKYDHLKEQVSYIEQITLALAMHSSDVVEYREGIQKARDQIKKVIRGQTCFNSSSKG